MIVTSAIIGNAVFSALKTQVVDTDGNPIFPTVAEGRVYMPMDWPVEEIDIPILKISGPTEHKQSAGKGGINFNTACAIEVTGEVSRLAEPDNASAAIILQALGFFQREIELAVIGDPTIFGGKNPALVSQLVSVQTKYATTSAGKMARGAISMTFTFEFFQGREDFQLPTTTAIDRFHIYTDLINVADPNGTYTPPLDYTPTPAPRTEGPDGRIEGEMEIIIPPQT